jgi:hypothetical protein
VGRFACFRLGKICFKPPLLLRDVIIQHTAVSHSIAYSHLMKAISSYFTGHGLLWTVINTSSLLSAGFIHGYPEQSSIPGKGAGFTNYFGAAIFIGYMIAALILTGLIIQSLRRSYNEVTMKNHGRIFNHGLLYAYIAAASLSFAVLSYTMLSFLIASYQEWCHARYIVPSSIPAVDLISSIWQWTTTSTLFLDFARSLCSTQAGYYWVMQALLGTMITNITMSSAGQRYAVPDLQYYFMIGQILPISFAASLFSIAAVIAVSGPKKEIKSVRLLPTTTLIPILIAYRLMLELLPRKASSSDFMLLVGATRLLLYLTSLVHFPATWAFEKQYERAHLTSTIGCMAVLGFASFLSGAGSLDISLRHARENPAVAALGVDYMLLLASLTLLPRLGRMT